MTKAKKISKKDLAVKHGMYKGYSINWLKKLRAEGEPHPEADYLIEEFDAFMEKQPKAKEVEEVEEETSESEDSESESQEVSENSEEKEE